VTVKINEDTNYGISNAENEFEIRVEVSKILQVQNIRPNSPALEADIRIGDRILKLNGKSVDSMELEEINDLLSSEDGKRIKIQLKRGEIKLTKIIYLSSQLN
jgi:C-terminal processing protease CtpA/Prc